MQVVVGLGIAPGGQHDRKIPACSLSEVTQEATLRAALVPVALDADRGAVRQAEAGDVDRLTTSMLAPSPRGSRILPPAGIAAEVIDPGRAAAELVERQGLHDLALKFVEAVGPRAAPRRGMVERRVGTASLYGGVLLARVVRRDAA